MENPDVAGSRGSFDRTEEISESRFHEGVLWALVGIGVVFLGYEVVERAWLRDAYPGLLYYFHIVRGVGVSLFAALIVGWYMVRFSPFSGPQARVLENLYLPGEAEHTSSMETFSRWLIRSRWVLIGVILLVILLAQRMPFVDMGVRNAWLMAVLTVVGWGGSNLVYQWWQNHSGDVHLQLFTQLCVDLVLMTILLSGTGGLRNPFFLFFLFYTVLSAVLFSAFQAYLITSWASVLLLLLGALQWGGWIRFPFAGREGGIQPFVGETVFVYGRLLPFLLIMFGLTAFTNLLMGLIRSSRLRIRRETSRREKLLKKFFETQEEERARVARELHDQIGQSLSALRLRLNQTPLDPEPVRNALEDAIEEVRTLSAQIRPPALEDAGLIRVIENHVRQFQSLHEVNVEFEHPGLSAGDELPEMVELALYRLVQEAMLNAAVHGEADQISVVLHRRDDEVQVLVEDDGRGFDPDQRDPEERETQLGIQGMKERVQFLDGQFTLQSTPGQGTLVKARLPLTA